MYEKNSSFVLVRFAGVRICEFVLIINVCMTEKFNAPVNPSTNKKKPNAKNIHKNQTTNEDEAFVFVAKHES